MKNDMTTNAPYNDDPRLTAYALGELDAADAAAMEQRLASDPTLRGEIDAIRATAASLRAGFAAEPVAALTDSQRSKIMRPPMPALRLAMAEAAHVEQEEEPISGRIFVMRSRWIGAGLAAAAVIALSVTAAILLQPDRKDDAGVAISKRAESLGSGKEAEANLKQFEGGAAGDKAIVNETLATTPPPGNRSDGLAAGDVGALAEALNKDAAARPDASAALRAESRDSLALSDEKQKAAQRPGDPAAAAGGRMAGGDGSGDTSSLRRSVGAGGSPAPAAPVVPPAKSATMPPPAEQPQQAPAPPPLPMPAGGGGGGAAPGDAVAPSGGASPPRTEPSSSTGAAKPQAAGPDPAASSDTGRSRSAGAPAASAPGVGVSSGEGQPGGLRQPSREAAEAAPTVRLLSDDEIAKLEADQVRDALKETADQRGIADRDQLRRQLDKQAEHLNSRLRAIEAHNSEEYSRINDNPFVKVQGQAALSTFAADVDTASYANVRRFLKDGQLPPADAVRIEEMINYFRYDYAPPSAADGQAPFSANVEVASAPWNPEHRLVRIGLRGKEERMDMRKATSLIFLVDVSGSMNQPDKLPLVKASLKKLVAQLNGDDRLAIVTYQGNAGLALDSCYVNAENREKIDAAIETMQPGGSTNGAGGINLAYDLARQHFIKDGINRILLCTDGDFNVGVSGDDALVQRIEEQRKSGVFLTVLGFGKGNLKDSKMEKLADAGNGNAAYIDSIDEAQKVLVDQLGGTLVAIAKDVKFQVEFNPAKVGAYRLIGYENRMLKAEDFNNDAKDAGEIGSGHTMTALYEVVSPGPEADALALNEPAGEVDELEFQKPAPPAAGDAAKSAPSDDLLLLKIRYKEPNGEKSELLRFPVKDAGKSVDEASADVRFASAVAEFGMLLRRSPYRGGATFDHVLFLAQGALGDDPQGYRAQFMDLVRKAQALEKGQ